MYSEQCSCKALTAVLYPVYVNNGTNKACFPNWSHPRNLVLLYMCHHEAWSCTTLKECTPKISNYIIILETCLGEWASANFYHHLKFFFFPRSPHGIHPALSLQEPLVVIQRQLQPPALRQLKIIRLLLPVRVHSLM